MNIFNNCFVVAEQGTHLQDIFVPRTEREALRAVHTFRSHSTRVIPRTLFDEDSISISISIAISLLDFWSTAIFWSLHTLIGICISEECTFATK